MILQFYVSHAHRHASFYLSKSGHLNTNINGHRSEDASVAVLPHFRLLMEELRGYAVYDNMHEEMSITPPERPWKQPAEHHAAFSPFDDTTTEPDVRKRIVFHQKK